jgi:hypothetical protein
MREAFEATGSDFLLQEEKAAEAKTIVVARKTRVSLVLYIGLVKITYSLDEAFQEQFSINKTLNLVHWQGMYFHWIVRILHNRLINIQ